MATELFATAPSTPEASRPMAPAVEPAIQPDPLEIVVERRLLQQDGEGGSSSMTIFRVPAHVRDANKELYEPRLVSVGPYYRGREALRAMEQHKWRYLRDLVAMRPEASLADFVGAVRDVEQKARRCYSERTDIFDAAAGGQGADHGLSRRDVPGPEDFAEMLLLDGCFLLQFFIKWYKREPDELCDVGWGLARLQSDLLLMENQIPFFVLEKLFRLVAPESERFDLRRLILHHFSRDDSTFKELSTEVPTRDIHHLLHLFYEAFVPRAEEMALVHASLPRLAQYAAQVRQMGVWIKMAASKRFTFSGEMPMPRWMKPSSMAMLREPSAWFSKFTAPIEIKASVEPDCELPPPPLMLPSVTLLNEAGVRFKKKKSPRHLFDITFDKAKGVMRMPRVEVDKANMPLLVNLIAFEQTRGLRGTALVLSSYTALMSFLVRTGKDVEELQKRGIIDNLLASDDDAATSFFQQLGSCSSLDYREHLFAVMFADLNQYYESRWHKHKAKFLRDYCSSPWAMIAIAVAVFGFGFLVFKASMAIYSLVHHSH